MIRTVSLLVLAAGVTAGTIEISAGTTLARRDVYLMGTRARLAAHGTTREHALSSIEIALRILEDAERQLSTWRADSAISALNRTAVGTAWQADDALCRLLGEVYRWSRATDGAFDPAVGSLAAAWQIHGHGRVPSANDLEAARARTGLQLMTFDQQRCTLTRLGDVTLDVGAFGKGEALDRVAATLPAGGWMIDLGGQVSVGGPQPDGIAWTVDIADPRDRNRPYLQVALRSGSLATSGGSERDLDVDGTRVGHILDPRTGRPAAFHGTVTVWHERGIVADMLSTALYVMGVEEGLAWAEHRGIAAAYFIPDGNTVTLAATPAFARFIAPE